MTGGAKGIGAAIVRLLAAEGAVPVIVDRDTEAGAQLQNEVRSHGGGLRPGHGRARESRGLFPRGGADGQNIWTP